jgi:hypothetical protein
MKSESELIIYFNSRLSKLLEPLEHYRVQELKGLKVYFYWIIPGFILAFLAFMTQIPLLIIVTIFTPFLIIGFALQKFNKMSQQLTRSFKTKILPELLSFLFDDYEYIANQRIAKSVLEKSMIFPNHFAIAKGEDFMCFKMGRTSIMFCETRALNNREKVIFNGIFISATFNKNFKAKTFVLSEQAATFFLRIDRQLLNNFKRIRLEDPGFNKEFFVLSSDQVEARYILTPSFMQRLIDYKRKSKRGISFSFVENKLYCAIPNYTNLFEPPLFEPFNYKCIQRNYNSLKLYTDLVEDLNLNLRIWSKE